MYLLVLTGHFKGYEASHPAGASMPIGTTLTMSIDATTMETTDWGLGSETVSLGQLGTPFSLR